MTESLFAGTVSAPLYAVLSFDGRRLLLPQAEIRSLEPLLDVQAARAEFPGSIGAILFEGERWPVYGVNRELALLDVSLPTRRVCVMLSLGEGYLGLLCDEIAPFGSSNPTLQPLPACMARPDSPVHALVNHEGEIGIVTTTARLWAFLQKASDAGRVYD